MASKAIYSEVIELVLSVDAYEKNVNRAVERLMDVGKAAKDLRRDFNAAFNDPTIYQAMVNEMDSSIERQKELIQQAEKLNRIMQERVRLAAQEALATGRGQPVFTGNNPAAARYADAYKAQLQQEMNLKAISDTVLDEQIAEANRILAIQQRQVEAERAKQIVAKQNAQIAKEEADSRIRSTYGYKVGSVVSGARVGAGLDIAAGAAFGMGATNIGGMIYMMERFSYAAGIGQKNLGQLAEKFGLVKLTGDDATASIAKFGSSVITLGTAIATMAAPIGAMLAGGKLDKAVADMSTLLASATTEASKFNDMMNASVVSAIKLSETFNMDLVDVVGGFKTALSTGIEADELEKFGNVAGTVARGLGASFEDAAGILTTFKDTYTLEIGQLGAVSDVLFNAIDVGKFQIGDLRTNIGRVASSAAEAGVSLKDMTAGLATLTRVGMTTANAVTALNRFIQGVVNPTDHARKALESYGLATGHTAFKTKSLIQYLQELKSVTGGNADLLGDMFGTEQGRRGAVGLMANPQLLSEIRAAMDNVGTATIAANRAMNTFGENWGKIFTSVWDVIQAVGRDLLRVANDVFFPGGPLGTDNLVGVKSVMEGIGVVVKEVGTILITAFGAAYHTITAVYNIISSVVNLLTGEFKKAGEDIVSVATGFSGVFKGIAALATNVVTTYERVIGYSKGIEQSNDAVAESANTAAVAIRGMFDEDLTKAIDRIAKKTSTIFDNVVDGIRKARFELASAEFNRTYKAPIKEDGERLAAASQAEKDFFARLMKGIGLASSFAGGVYGSAEEYTTAKRKYITQGGGYDPEDPWTQEMMGKIREDRIRRQAEEEAKLEAEARKEAHRKYLLSIDPSFGEFLPTTGDGKVSGTPGQMSGILKPLQDLAEALQTMAGKGAVGTSLRDMGGSKLPTPFGTAVQQLTGQDAVEELRKLYKSAEEEYRKSKDKMAETDRIAYEKNLAAFSDQIDKYELKANKQIVDRYKQEYDKAKDLYEAKMSYLSREKSRLESILAKYDELLNKLKEARQSSQFERRGPEYEFRQRRDQVEEGVRNLKSITDPDKLIKAGEELLKAAELMRNAGKEAGGSYATTAAKQFEELVLQIQRIIEPARGKAQQGLKDVNSQESDAYNKYKQDIANNPIAQAALSQAMAVVSSYMEKAAANGIGVAGDLKVAVDISSIEANIPVEQFRKLIVDTATKVFADMYKDAKANKPTAGENDYPPGSDGTI